MACPYLSGKASKRRHSEPVLFDEGDFNLSSQEGKNKITAPSQLTYNSYLQLPRLLSSQYLQSSAGGKIPVHDEHLFIVTHQAIELWFKQIIYEVDSIRQIFADSYLEERNMLLVISRISRVSDILQILSDHFLVLETMTPQDFLDFRPFLMNGSGFQSLQFRLMEIKLGMPEDLRVQYNKQHYLEVFFGHEKETLKTALGQESLFSLVNAWLERTPGLEGNGFDFFNKFRCSVQAMHDEFEAFGEEIEDEEEKQEHQLEHSRGVETFNSIFDKNKHDELVAKGDRRFSHKALQGALMIYLYRDEPRFHLPFQLLQVLMNIDSHLTKFRYSHTCMVQRMIGRKFGTGGSSGYLYLRSTCSDRYKIFLDLMNLSSFLVPRDRIPPLNQKTRRCLSIQDIYAPEVMRRVAEDQETDSGLASSLCKTMRRISMSSHGSIDEKLESYRKSGKPESMV
ncbi:tryptophan 2,3-dioxygenase-like [Ciona intestinalis]